MVLNLLSAGLLPALRINIHSRLGSHYTDISLLTRSNEPVPRQSARSYPSPAFPHLSSVLFGSPVSASVCRATFCICLSLLDYSMYLLSSLAPLFGRISLISLIGISLTLYSRNIYIFPSCAGHYSRKLRLPTLAPAVNPIGTFGPYLP